MGKYGGVTVLSGFILYNLGFIFQLMAVPSSDWDQCQLEGKVRSLILPVDLRSVQITTIFLKFEKSKFKFVVQLRVRKKYIVTRKDRT